ncbi:MAG: helix-turn-helix domain-containing protein [Rhizobiales bacterium]|nr:helix-turn-helix domain-containing protein [Hyphomicrobiales bacterium]
MDHDRYLTTKEAAALLRYSPRSLEQLRITGGGPPFCKLGDGPRARVLYRLSDLRAWMETRLRSSTTDHAMRGH